MSNFAPEPEQEQIDSSRAERVLAIALVIFLLIGGIWILGRLGELVERPEWVAVAEKYGVNKEEQRLDPYRQALGEAQIRFDEAVRLETAAKSAYEFHREEYRTSLDRGVDDPVKKQRYEQATLEWSAAERRRQEAETVLNARREELAAEEQKLQALNDQVWREHNRLLKRYETAIFALRMAYAVPVFLLAWWLFRRMRQSRSKFTIIATALLTFAVLQLIGLAIHYLASVLAELSQIVISILGTLLTGGAIIWLRRTLFAPERVALARLRRHQCPYCGFPHPPLTAPPYCVQCGRQQSAACEHCGEARPVFAQHCPHCGRE